MTLCEKCHRRPAVVFITDATSGKQMGLCIQCAREAKIKPVEDMVNKMGLSDEDIDRMSADMEQFMSSMEEQGSDLPDLISDEDASKDENTDGHTNAMNLRALFNSMPDKEGRSEKREKKQKGKKEKERKFLNNYCQNLTARAAEGKLDRIVGRDRDLDRVIQILCRRQKNNPCLIGEPGVGKTAIAEALAQRIVDGEVPYKLKKSEIFLLDLTALLAGTQFRGQFESRVLGLLNEVKEAGNVILVIDEVHNIVGAGDSEGSMNAANMLKPALSRGEIQVIGATTLKEYRKYIEKDSALERRFQPVVVEEPSLDDTVAILRGIKHYYEEYHGISIPDKTLDYAVRFSERYITDRYLPDKAIDLIDEAASHLSLSTPEINERAELIDRRNELQKELAELESKANEGDEPKNDVYERLAELKAEELKTENRIIELDDICSKVEITVADLADVIEIWTGIPASSIKEDEYEGLEGLESRIKERIVGQDEAVNAVCRAVRRGRVGVSAKRKPVSFIFAGPTGVGKTELVRVLANDLFKTPETLIRLDMSEYMEKFSVSRLIGSPPGYVGYDDAGQLTEKIRRRPYSVVLFDEIEKAHPDVMNILLQILDDGRITDAQGHTVNFENTIIVMTTNAGSMGSARLPGFTGDVTAQSSDRTMKALSDFLRPEFLNRVDEIITFNSLTHENFTGIARIMMEDLKKALSERFITLRYDDAVCDAVAKGGFSDKFGARNMRRFIQTKIEDKIASLIVESHGKATDIALSVSDGEIVVNAL